MYKIFPNHQNKISKKISHIWYTAVNQQYFIDVFLLRLLCFYALFTSNLSNKGNFLTALFLVLLVMSAYIFVVSISE